MISRLIIIQASFLILTLFVLNSCVQQQVQTTPDVFFPITDQLLAENNEDAKNYIEALRYWENAADIVSRKITTISTKLRELSEHHALKGVDYYNERNARKAAVQFLKSLKYDPANRIALDYMLNKYQPVRTITYRVKLNDTFELIADHIYGSKTESFIIPIFSEIKDERDLVPGTVITLPTLYSFISQPIENYKKNIINSRKYYNQKRYKDVISLAYKILEENKKDKEATFLLNSSLIKLAEIEKQEYRYQKAINHLSKVSPSFRNTESQIKELEELLSVQQRYDRIIDNAKLFEKGKKLFQQKKYKEALEQFLQIEPNYKDVQLFIGKTRKKLNSLAEIHYKKGVKFFIEENLKMAIKEWELTLKYNPDHQSALDYIEKAHKLMRKIKTID